jgi:outer membrane protein OmpA-like peptidoglycan-associated protein
LRFEQARELSTEPINVRQVEVRPLDIAESATPEDLVTPPTDAASLLEEVDLLSALPKDLEIDIKPDIQEAEYALQMKNPASQGDPAAVAMEVSASLEVEADLPELGREPEHLKPAEVGQVTVDPGAVPVDDNDLGKFTEDLIKRGANGKVEKGALDGVASLDALLDLPPNILLGKKTMLPSDLLFEFNSAELRESAKVGLMKLALLIDRNPNLYCWIEGHTDLVGGDEFNLDLSIRRSEAVKNYLTDSLRMDAARISTRGFGRYAPLVIRGTTDEQAVNRRVEIRMRKTPPPTDQLKISPQKAAVVGEPAAPPKAVLVKPNRALPVTEESAPPRAEPVPPRAAPVDDPQAPPTVPKATPVEPAPPPPAARAQPVAE